MKHTWPNFNAYKIQVHQLGGFYSIGLAVVTSVEVVMQSLSD